MKKIEKNTYIASEDSTLDYAPLSVNKFSIQIKGLEKWFFVLLFN